MIESGVLTAAEGMWMSSFILLPISLFLTYKAAKDAALFDRDTYTKIADRVRVFFESKRGKTTQ